MTPAQLCKCLADDTRLQIMVLLWQRGETCVCDLVHCLALPQPTVSRQLGQLRGCGLLSVRRDARWAWYQVAPDLPGWAREVVAQLVTPALSLYPDTLNRSALCCGAGEPS